MFPVTVFFPLICSLVIGDVVGCVRVRAGILGGVDFGTVVTDYLLSVA